MRELAYQSISGTPGTAAALTVVAVAGNPRLDQVAPVGSPIFYTVEIESSGQAVCTGVGKATGAGAFTRLAEFSSYDGTDYGANPAALASIPAGCVIYCSLSGQIALPSFAPTSNVSANRWFDPSGQGGIVTTAFTVGAANRDYFWRDRLATAQKIDAFSIHAAAIGVLDLGLYEIDWATGGPGVLLLGWQGFALAAGMNTLLLTAATLGVLPKAAQRPPIADVIWMANWSATTANPARTKDATAALSGSETADLSGPQHLLYAPRANNSTFGDSPALTGRITTAAAKVPSIGARGV